MSEAAVPGFEAASSKGGGNNGVPALGRLLGWSKAQQAIDELVRGLGEFNAGLRAARQSLDQQTRASRVVNGGVSGVSSTGQGAGRGNGGAVGFGGLQGATGFGGYATFSSAAGPSNPMQAAYQRALAARQPQPIPVRIGNATFSQAPSSPWSPPPANGGLRDNPFGVLPTPSKASKTVFTGQPSASGAGNGGGNGGGVTWGAGPGGGSPSGPTSRWSPPGNGGGAGGGGRGTGGAAGGGDDGKKFQDALKSGRNYAWGVFTRPDRFNERVNSYTDYYQAFQGDSTHRTWKDLAAATERNNQVAHGQQDAAQASGMYSRMGGYTSGGGGDKAYTQIVSGGLLDPSMSSTDLMNAQGGFQSGRTINKLRAMGVNALGSGGTVKSIRDLANELLTKWGAYAKIKTVDDLNYSLNTPSGGLNQNINNYVSNGLIPAQSEQAFRNEVYGIMKSKISGGMSYQQYNNTMNGAARGNKKDAKALDKVGLGGSEKQKIQSAENQKSMGGDTSGNITAFDNGLTTATGALTDFYKALQVLTKGPLGTALNNLGGASGVLMNTVSGGLLAYGGKHLYDIMAARKGGRGFGGGGFGGPLGGGGGPFGGGPFGGGPFGGGGGVGGGGGGAPRKPRRGPAGGPSAGGPGGSGGPNLGDVLSNMPDLSRGGEETAARIPSPRRAPGALIEEEAHLARGGRLGRIMSAVGTAVDAGRSLDQAVASRIPGLTNRAVDAGRSLDQAVASRIPGLTNRAVDAGLAADRAVGSRVAAHAPGLASRAVGAARAAHGAATARALKGASAASNAVKAVKSVSAASKALKVAGTAAKLGGKLVGLPLTVALTAMDVMGDAHSDVMGKRAQRFAGNGHKVGWSDWVSAYADSAANSLTMGGVDWLTDKIDHATGHQTLADSKYTGGPAVAGDSQNALSSKPGLAPARAGGSTMVKLSWPVGSRNITSPFGSRPSPGNVGSTFHEGIDIAVPVGTPVAAAAAGTVTTANMSASAGNWVVIDHGNGLVTEYMHMSRLATRAGARVAGGAVIGYSGNTGHSTGPHLHFQVNRNGTAVNPMSYLGGGGPAGAGSAAATASGAKGSSGGGGLLSGLKAVAGKIGGWLGQAAGAVGGFLGSVGGWLGSAASKVGGFLGNALGLSSGSSTSSSSAGSGAAASGAYTGNYGSVSEADALSSAYGRSGAVAAGVNATAALNNALGSAGSGSAGSGGSGGGATTGDGSSVHAGQKFSGGVEQWRGTVVNALKIMNQPAGLVDDVLARMNRESGGNPTIVNRTDSNWQAGHPSVGLMQVIGGTYSAYKVPGHDGGGMEYGVSTDPLNNILASMNYSIHRYGSLQAAYNKSGGYAKGAWELPQDEIAKVHKGEMIIPARPAETIRNALLKEAHPTFGGAGGHGTTVHIGREAIVIQVKGAMDESTARKAGNTFADTLADRLKQIQGS